MRLEQLGEHITRGLKWAASVLTSAAPHSDQDRWWPVRNALILITLWSFAVSQPAFELMNSHHAFLKDVGATGTTLRLLVLLIAALGPLVMISVLAAARRCGRGEAPLFTLFALLLWGALGLMVLRDVPVLLLFPLLAVCLAGLVLATRVSRYLRDALCLSAVSLLVFPALFLSPARNAPLLTSQSQYAGPARVSREVPVVMVIFDELSGASLWDSERQIDENLFPNFARLSRDTLWFRNASTVHGRTASAVPAILSGQYPPPEFDEPHQPRDHLFSLLVEKNRYEALVLEPVTRLCTAPATDRFHPAMFGDGLIRAYVRLLVPLDIHFTTGFPKIKHDWYGISSRLPDGNASEGVIRHSWHGRRDLQFAQLVKSLEESDRPKLHFLHLVFPHFPLEFDTSGRKYTRTEHGWDFDVPHDIAWSFDPSPFSDVWPTDPLFVAQGRVRHVWQLQAADRWIGELREKLIETGMYDRCLLVVMADHGVSMRPGGHRRIVDSANHLDIMSVPLFIKPPGMKSGGTSDLPAETTDVFPTIQAILGVNDWLEMDGRNLLQSPFPSRPSKRFVDEGGLRVMQPNYPANVPPAEWPAAAALAETELQELADPDHLTGRRLDEFTFGSPVSAQIEWIDHQDVDPTAPTSPVVYRSGRIVTSTPVDRPLRLALVLDNRVIAVTRTFYDVGLNGQFLFLHAGSGKPPKVSSGHVYLVERTKSGHLLRPVAKREPTSD